MTTLAVFVGLDDHQVFVQMCVLDASGADRSFSPTDAVRSALVGSGPIAEVSREAGLRHRRRHRQLLGSLAAPPTPPVGSVTPTHGEERTTTRKDDQEKEDFDFVIPRFGSLVPTLGGLTQADSIVDRAVVSTSKPFTWAHRHARIEDWEPTNLELFTPPSPRRTKHFHRMVGRPMVGPPYESLPRHDDIFAFRQVQADAGDFVVVDPFAGFEVE